MAEIAPDAARHGRSSRAFCAEVSREHAEPLGATASRVDHWILVEYRRLWSRDPIAGSGLPDEAKAHLRAQLRRLPNSRLLFVRRPGPDQPEILSVFFGSSLESGPRFFRAAVSSYAELSELDIASALTGGAVAGETLPHPLFVVCTHGKRDRCCARYGRPLYDELAEELDPGWVWQSTHVGGDRFAGNLVCLPEGLYFGRVDRQDAWGLLDEYLAGRIELGRYRGRSCYGFAAQAAERLVREETGLTGIGDIALERAHRLAPDAWSIRFRGRESGAAYEVDVASRLAEEATYLTCSSPTPQRPRRHLATGYRVTPR